MRFDNDDTPWAVKLTPKKEGPLAPYIRLFGCNSNALMYGLADLAEREELARRKDGATRR